MLNSLFDKSSHNLVHNTKLGIPSVQNFPQLFHDLSTIYFTHQISKPGKRMNKHNKNKAWLYKQLTTH